MKKSSIREKKSHNFKIKQIKTQIQNLTEIFKKFVKTENQSYTVMTVTVSKNIAVKRVITMSVRRAREILIALRKETTE